jgi:hypothetical protein
MTDAQEKVISESDSPHTEKQVEHNFTNEIRR